MNRKFRTAFLVLAAIAPNVIKQFIYRYALGWTIGKHVDIGFSFIDADNVIIGDNVSIGHLNIIRTIRVFEIGDGSVIKNSNQFNGGRNGGKKKWKSRLIIGKRASVMSHHFIDACGEVTLSDGATLAGRGSHLWSHTIAFTPEGKRDLLPTHVNIGPRVYVGANSTLLGCQIPHYSIVGAGSLVNKKFEAAADNVCLLIAGSPAKIKKEYFLAEDADEIASAMSSAPVIKDVPVVDNVATLQAQVQL